MDKASNLRVYEQCIHRHWCPSSETFTGADSLVTALYQGWQIVDYRIEKQYHGVSQGVVIYIFTLWSEDNCVVMSVIGNPYVERLVGQLTEQLNSNTNAYKRTGHKRAGSTRNPLSRP